MIPLWLWIGGAAGLALLAASAGDDAPAPPPPTPPPPSPRPAETNWSQGQKLSAADPRLHLPELLARMRALGWQPSLSYTWRSLPSQDILRAQGATTVSFSFHNAVDEAGYPAGQAADITDRRYGWGDEDPASARTRGAAGFYAALGPEAKRLGLSWGGDWSRSNIWAHYNLGWDPGHVQVFENSAPPRVQAACLPRILGTGVRKQGSGGIVYRQYWTGYILIEQGAGRGRLLLPQGNRRAWEAVTAEIGPYSGGNA